MSDGINLREYNYWSPVLGEDAVRFSVFDDNGKEYFAVVASEGTGQSLRALRQEWGERIYAAMQKQAPGEVK